MTNEENDVQGNVMLYPLKKTLEEQKLDGKWAERLCDH